MKALKWIGIGLGIIFAILLVAGISLYFAIRPYLASDSFRRLLEAEVSKQLEVETLFEPLQWKGLTVFTNSIKTTGASKVAIKSMDVQQLRISFALRPLLRQVARIDRIEMQSLEMEFQVPEPQPETPSARQEPVTPPPAWIQSIAPQKVEIGEIAIQQGKLRWPAGENTFGQLSQFKVQASVDGDDFNLWVREGKLQIPQLPELELQTLKGRTHQKTVFITNATLQYEKQGTLSIDGELGFDSPTTAHLNFDLNSVPMNPFLPGDWRARLLGNLNAKLKLTQDEKTNGIPQVTGLIEVSQGKIEALPIFNKIGDIIKIIDSNQIDRWRSVPLDRAQFNLNWTPQKTILEKIDLESKKLLLFQGDVQIEGDNLSGKTNLGIDPSFLKLVPGTLDQIFTQTSGEFATTPVELSGTIDDPKEDLTERIANVAISGLLQKLPGGVGEKIQNVTDELQKKVPGLFDLFKKQ